MSRPTSAGMEPFQEYDCPHTGIDFDLSGDRILVAGEVFDCPGCGGQHQAGVDGPRETVFPTGASEEPWFTFRALPADSAEKALWLAQAAA